MSAVSHEKGPYDKISPPGTSEALYAAAREVMSGGISHQLRHAKPHPKYIVRAQGARKWEVDGKEYIDFSMGSASQLLGHAHPDVVAALQAQAPLGTFFADCTPLEVDWARRVCDLIPSAERVRFVGSGTEATMLAIRLGRAHSGRRKIIRFDGHYHGWHDHVMPGAQPGSAAPPSLGVPREISEITLVLPCDPDAVEDALAADPEIGTVICEASGANYGCTPLPEGFLSALREITARHEAVLIFDEVITGFRWSPGGRQAAEGVIPDLTALAKTVTGGMPGGAVGGRAEIMALLDPDVTREGLAPAVKHQGTFNAAPIVAAPAIATLKHLATGRPQAIADARAEQLRSGFNEILRRLGVEGLAYGWASVFHLRLGRCPKGSVEGLSPAELRGMPKDLVSAFRRAVQSRGLDLMSYTSGVTSAAHSEEDIHQALEIFEAALRELRGDML